VEASAGKMLRSGKKEQSRRMRNKQQSLLRDRKLRMKKRVRMLLMLRDASRVKGKEMRMLMKVKSTETITKTVDEDWLDEKPPAKSAKITTPKRRRSQKCPC
jgi:hypothetical protein